MLNRSTFLVFIFALLLPFIAMGQSDSVQYYFRKGKEAYEAKDHVVFYSMMTKAHRLHPYHPSILYQTALASALNQKPAPALDLLRKALYVKANIDLQNEDLSILKEFREFAMLQQLQKDLLLPRINSDTAFTIGDRSLHIESIASGEDPGVFYAGSIHKRKIVRISPDRTVTDFTVPAQDGLTSVFGIKVDKNRKLLWACSSPIQEMENYDSATSSAVYQYDLKTRKLLHQYLPTGVEEKEFVFGDLALDPQGNVFVSDSRNNLIFKVNEKNYKLELFFRGSSFWNMQGLTFNEDGTYLFISDYIKGIYKLKVKTKELTKVIETFDLSTKSIDGLTYYKNSLIAIQNSIYPMRVTRYFLNPNASELTGYTIIDNAHPAFNEPTIGCLEGDTFYYVANSIWSGYTDKHELKPITQLPEVVILMADLKALR
jgi:hypothetical protein